MPHITTKLQLGHEISAKRPIISFFAYYRTVEKVADVPAGHICGLVGVDEFLLKSGTVTTLKSNHDIREIRFITSPVMKVAVEPTNGTELPELVQGL